MIEALISIIGEVFGEALVQILVQLLADLGEHSLAAHGRGARSPGAATLGHLLFGALLGGISLLLLPHSLLHSPGARLANLVCAPLAAGAVTAIIGVFLRLRGRPTVELERFFYGWLFAFCFAGVRALGTGGL